MWVLLIKISFGLGVATLGTLVGLQEYAAAKIKQDQERIRVLAAMHLKDFLNDQKIVGENSFFVRSEHARDAGPFLNARIPWVEGNSAPDRNKGEFTKGLSDVESSFKSWKDMWLEHAGELNYSRFNLAWMGQLESFDYWEIEKNSPAADLFSKNPSIPGYLYGHPLPDFISFERLAKIRLMKGVAEKQVLAALRETRQLAKMLYTTEHLPGLIVAHAILGLERRAYEYALQQHLLKQSEWEVLPESTCKRANRILLASATYFSLFTEPDILRTALTNEHKNLGVCAGLREGMTIAIMARPLLEPHVPLERDFRVQYRSRDEVVTKASTLCRLTNIRALWGEKPSIARWIAQEDNVPENIQNEMGGYKLMPFVRKAIGMIVIQAATSEKPLQRYEKPLE